MGKCFSLVTGASSGMGLEYAEELAAKGHNILVVSNRDEDNKSVAAMLERDYGVEAIPLYSDLSRFEAAQELYDWTKSQDITVDILISNAGLLVFNKLENTSPKQVELIVGVHCVAPTNLCRLFGTDMVNRAKALSESRMSLVRKSELEKAGLAPGEEERLSRRAQRKIRRAGKLRRGEGGYVLIMSSLAAYLPYPTISLYSATKAYSKSLGTSLWHEYRDWGINVTTVCPSAVDTPLITLRPSLRKLARHLGVMITPQRLVKSALRSLFRGRRILIPSAVAKLAMVFCSLLPQHSVNRICHWPVLKHIFDRV